MIKAKRIPLTLGEHSPFRRAKTIDRLLRACRNIERRVVEGSGHPPRLLARSEVDTVRAFLEGRSSGARGRCRIRGAWRHASGGL